MVMIAVFCCWFLGTESVKLTALNVPSYGHRGKDVSLGCEYDLEGDALYTLKWLLDDRIFFGLYAARSPPAYVLYEDRGVAVKSWTADSIVLSELKLENSGAYRCEVTARGEAFTSAEGIAEMIVVDIPKELPVITGYEPSYKIGDAVNVNCTSAVSSPPARLEWIVNGEKADPELARRKESVLVAPGLYKTRRGLEFKAEEKHFKNGRMKLKCLARIWSLYRKSTERTAALDVSVGKVSTPSPPTSTSLACNAACAATIVTICFFTAILAILILMKRFAT